MKFRFTEEELSRGKLVPPDTYLLEIVDVKEGTGEGDDGEFEFQKVFLKIIGGEYEGVRLQQYGDERYPGLMRGLIEALTGKELKAGDEVDMSKEKLLGKRVKGEVVRGSYKARSGKEYPTNQIEAFYPAA